MSFYDNLTSAEKLRLTERLLPQLGELLAIARKLAADLMNKGTVECGYSRIYARDKQTHCERQAFHMDKPNASYQFIEIGAEWSERGENNRKLPLQYIQWGRDGARYSIKWDMNPNGARRETIARKFLCFRWNAKVVHRFRQIQVFEFESNHNDDALSFQMNQRELDGMSIELHTQLCNLLAAQKYQYENIIKYISTASGRKENEERQNTLRHFEELLTPSGDTNATTSHSKQ